MFDDNSAPWNLCDHAAHTRVEWVPVDTSGPEEDWIFELVIICGECPWSAMAPISWRSQTDMVSLHGPGGAKQS